MVSPMPTRVSPSAGHTRLSADGLTLKSYEVPKGLQSMAAMFGHRDNTS